MKNKQRAKRIRKAIAAGGRWVNDWFAMKRELMMPTGRILYRENIKGN